MIWQSTVIVLLHSFSPRVTSEALARVEGEQNQTEPEVAVAPAPPGSAVSPAGCPPCRPVLRQHTGAPCSRNSGISAETGLSMRWEAHPQLVGGWRRTRRHRESTIPATHVSIGGRGSQLASFHLTLRPCALRMILAPDIYSRDGSRLLPKNGFLPRQLPNRKRRSGLSHRCICHS